MDIDLDLPVDVPDVEEGNDDEEELDEDEELVELSDGEEQDEEVVLAREIPPFL